MASLQDLLANKAALEQEIEALGNVSAAMPSQQVKAADGSVRSDGLPTCREQARRGRSGGIAKGAKVAAEIPQRGDRRQLERPRLATQVAEGRSRLGQEDSSDFAI